MSTRLALLWGVFFLICCGLGYPTLNRYDPRVLPGTSDSAQYSRLVEQGLQHEPDTSLSFLSRYRVVVPYAAKPFYWLAAGRIGIWNPALFALLVANAIFVATTACLLLSLGRSIIGDGHGALVGSLIYLANFNIVNYQLAGLVDSSEACSMLALVWALRSRRWALLPILGVFGALSKETFIPLALVFAVTWLALDRGEASRRRSAFGWVVAMGACGLAAVVLLQYLESNTFVSPWSVVRASRGEASVISGLLSPFADRQFWFVMLVPAFGLVELNAFPKQWVWATGAASLAALTLGAWHDAGGGGTARAMFDVCGPLLCLSAARLFTKLAAA